MATQPSSLDVLDSQLGSSDVGDYHAQLSALHASFDTYWTFETVPDQFKQSLPGTDDLKFNYLNEHFGVIGSWDALTDRLATLNRDADANTTYKLLFLARHGQGYHNVGHARYGNKAWNEYWSKLNGDGEIVWGPDPELTELGIAQARDNNVEWQAQLAAHPQIKPTKWFVSPLRRSIDTLINTWDGVASTGTVLIQENLRETVGEHTCDKRSPKTVIDGKYAAKGFVFEAGFVEEDIYWQPDVRETVAEHAIRINKSLQAVFNGYDDEIVSLTSHSGSIRAQLLVLNHRLFAVGTGGMIPVFVKGTRHTK